MACLLIVSDTDSHWMSQAIVTAKILRSARCGEPLVMFIMLCTPRYTPLRSDISMQAYHSIYT